MRSLLPRNSELYTNLTEVILAHPKVASVAAKCRARARKTVVGIDGQYSVLLNVLYQVPHGQPGSSAESTDNDLHTFLTVQCKDTVLLARAYPSEAAPHQIDALKARRRRGGCRGCPHDHV